MSWSITVIGAPSKVSAKLDEYSARLSGSSKIEFDDAKPHIQALIAQNIEPTMIKLTASGHAFVEKEKKHGNCIVSIEQIYAEIAL